jgi:hypothetical protein
MSRANQTVNKVSIIWSYEDIQSICPQLSDDEAIEALQTIHDTFKDRATEECWQVLELILEDYGFLERGDDDESN